jgi:hypothetical protein
VAIGVFGVPPSRSDRKKRYPHTFIMEAVVPQEITAELTQILANLVLGDNKIRSKYGSAYLTNRTCSDKMP